MRRLKLVSAVIIFAALVSNAHAQSVDDIIDGYVKARGGLDKLMAIKTIRYTGSLSGMGAEIPLTQVIKRDNKVRMEMSFQGQTMVQAYDGSTGWFISPFSGKNEPDKMTPEQIKQMRESAEIEGRLCNYKDKGYTVELEGKDDLEGTDTYKIKLTDKDGDISYYWIDSQSFLLLKQSAKRKFKEKEVQTSTSFSNYQPTDGVQFPMSKEIKSEGREGSQKIIYTKIETNIDLDDSLFKMPETKN